MPRHKAYSEEKVIKKAMHVFWKNGFYGTSARMLEKEMDINLFSIYSSFQNKDGVFLESMKTYKRLNRKTLLDPLKKGTTPEDIKMYFVNFLKFTKENGVYNGCLLINSAQELGNNMPDTIGKEIENYSHEVMSALLAILFRDLTKSEEKVQKEANSLFVSLVGLITTAKSLKQTQINDYIEMIFSKL